MLFKGEFNDEILDYTVLFTRNSRSLLFGHDTLLGAGNHQTDQQGAVSSAAQMLGWHSKCSLGELKI